MKRELTTKAAKLAMMSNVMFGWRSIVRSELPKDFKVRTRLDAKNEFAITTMLSFALLLPLVARMEGFGAVMDSINGNEASGALIKVLQPLLSSPAFVLSTNASNPNPNPNPNQNPCRLCPPLLLQLVVTTAPFRTFSRVDYPSTSTTRCRTTFWLPWGQCPPLLATHSSA